MMCFFEDDYFIGQCYEYDKWIGENCHCPIENCCCKPFAEYFDEKLKIEEQIFLDQEEA